MELLLKCIGNLEASNRLQLFNDVIYKLNPDIAPFESAKTNNSVRIDLHVTDITNINEKRQTMAGSYWVVLEWTDHRLQWNPDLYGNITSVFLKADKIWSPTSICVYNDIGDEKCIKANQDMLTVHSSGLVSYMKYKYIVSQCVIDVTSYPFDSHMCTIIIGNLNRDTEYLHFNANNSNFLDDYLLPNEVWNIQSTTFFLKEYYEPLISNIKQQFDFQIQLKRKSFYVVISTLLPVVILSVLNLLCFWVPIESGEKMGFCMAIFLTFAVFLTMITDSMPKTSDKVPYFTVYLITQLVISGLVVSLETIVLFVHFHFSTEKGEKKNVCSERKCSPNGAQLDVIFFLLILGCNISSLLFYFINVL
jgi:hypothetical protein